MEEESGATGVDPRFSNKMAEVDRVKHQDNEAAAADPPPKSAPFYKLFSFADSTDVVLMIVGTIAAVGNGLSLPLMTVLFGEVTDSFGQNQGDKDVVHAVSKVCTWLISPRRSGLLPY